MVLLVVMLIIVFATSTTTIPHFFGLFVWFSKVFQIFGFKSLTDPSGF